MKTSESEINVAASAADRPVAPALPPHPLVAAALWMFNGIFGPLLRRKLQPTVVRRVKLESYSSLPIVRSSAGFPQGSGKVPARETEGSPKRRPAAPPRRRSAASVAAALPQEGGLRHG